MAKGLTRDTAQLWAFLRADKGWWSVLRLTGHWAPTFTLREIEEHMVTLYRGGFVAATETESMGTVYAVTPQCSLLPGTEEPTPTPPAVDSDAPVPPARPEVMSTVYQPTASGAYRAGALDHQRYPSLIGNKRLNHWSTRT